MIVHKHDGSRVDSNGISTLVDFSAAERAAVYLAAAKLIRQGGGEHYCLSAVEKVLNPVFPRKQRKSKKPKSTAAILKSLCKGDSPLTSAKVNVWMAHQWKITPQNMPELALFMPEGGHYNQCWWGHASKDDPEDAWKFEANITALLLSHHIALDEAKAYNQFS